MTYTNFATRMIREIYRQSSENDGKIVSFKDAASRILPDIPDHYMDKLHQEWARDGVAEFIDDDSDPDNFYVDLSAQGLRLAESSLSQGDAPAIRRIDAVSIDSARWTGIAQRLQRSERVVDEIKCKMREVDDLVEQSGLTNSERQKAKAISEALIKLVESPEPEWKAIVELLNSPALTAVLNVVTVAQLVISMISGQA